MTSFIELGVPKDVARRLSAKGIGTPFPIQTATLPDALAGRDICGRAPTGSGKTLAFSLPLALRVGQALPHRPRGLVLVPTRELASQVTDTLRPLGEARQRRVATVYGGTSINKDIQRLRRGIDILVATPGRLRDLIDRGACDLGDVDLVVLDEADRMADMGFLPEVKRLLDQTAEQRQTLLFSATLDGDVDVLVRRYQTNPVRHEVATDEDDRADVRHLFWPAAQPDRRKVTADIVGRLGPAIVFTRTKRGADRLARQLNQDGIPTAAIHGDRTQRQREQALRRFTQGEVTTLVATDVAARGIHVDDVGVVVHYDLPGSDKDYLHRSGRTGRAGARGVVVTLVMDDQVKDLDAIQRMLELPRGLHRPDLAHLTSEHAPAPDLVPTLHRGTAPRTAGRGRPSGGGGSKARSNRSRARARR